SLPRPGGRTRGAGRVRAAAAKPGIVSGGLPDVPARPREVRESSGGQPADRAQGGTRGARGSGGRRLPPRRYRSLKRSARRPQGRRVYRKALVCSWPSLPREVHCWSKWSASTKVTTSRRITSPLEPGTFETSTNWKSMLVPADDAFARIRG